MDNNTQLALTVSKQLLIQTSNELNMCSARLLSKYYNNAGSIEEVYQQMALQNEKNGIITAVYLKNGRPVYDKTAITYMVFEHFSHNVYIKEGQLRPKLGRIIAQMPHFIKNIQVMMMNTEIENKIEELRQKYLSDDSRYSFYNSLCDAQKQLLSKLENNSSEAAMAVEKAEFYGSRVKNQIAGMPNNTIIDGLINQVIIGWVNPSIKEFEKDIAELNAMREKRNQKRGY